MFRLERALPAALAVLIVGGGSATAACQNTTGFDQWLAEFKSEAAAGGISQSTINTALRGVSFDPAIIKRDRKQAIFSMSFLKFAGRLISQNRLNLGRANLKKHRRTFARIEEQYGVPGPVLAAFWGLETDYGGFMGDFPVLRSLATLAYDCRRPDLFRPHLMNALRLIEDGDLKPREMVGAWAGELGHTQFMPTEYYESAVDFDGDGKRDLVRSIPDALASAANVLNHFGWRAGEPWLEEVRVPQELPWDQADLKIRHPRSQWADWGVVKANGQAVASDAMPTALLLPMGRNGPAFLAYRNFDVYLEWNKSLTYSTTAAYFATRLAGAKKVRPGNGKVQPLSHDEIKILQRRLEAAGYDVGGVDGTIGAMTRAAVKAVQIKLGMPADSYPTKRLLDKLP